MNSYDLYFDLQERGFTFRAEGDGLYIEPRFELTERDCAMIRMNKAALLSIATNQITPTDPETSTFYLSIPCLACGSRATLQDKNGWWFCAYDRKWMKAEDGKVVLLEAKEKSLYAAT